MGIKLNLVLIPSDDYTIHFEAFAEAAKILIADGILTVDDFHRNGGWVKSVDFKYSYFVYPCKDLHIRSRYYFDVFKQEIFQWDGKASKIILYRRKNGPRNAPYVAASD